MGIFLTTCREFFSHVFIIENVSYTQKPLALQFVQCPLTLGKFVQNLISSSTPHIASQGQV